MSNLNQRRAAVWLGVLLFAVAFSVPLARAQTASGDAKRWRDCDLVRTIPDQHYRGPNFTVKVSFRYQGISGVRVVLVRTQPDESGRYVAATGDTDPDGVAHFFSIPPGMYQAHVDEGLLAPSEQVDVDTATAESEVGIEWPDAPIVTQSVRGWISSWQRATPQSRSERLPLQHVLVQLLDLRTAKLLANTYTSPEGYYEFAGFGDGLYVVRVSEHPDPSINGYDKAVEVAKDAIRQSMPRLVVDNACGGGLAEFEDTDDRQRTALLAGSAPGRNVTK